MKKSLWIMKIIFSIKKIIHKPKCINEKAAEQGYAEAQNRLGIMFSSSDYDLEINYAKAKEYYEQAAEQGLKQAQFNLGNMYKLGNGVPQDYAQTIKWYKKAAAQEAAPAQYGLGDMYAKGLGVRNPRVIYTWG